MKHTLYLVPFLMITFFSYTVPSLPLKPNQAQQIINTVYKNLNGYVIPPQESASIRTAGGDPTYGEITFEALQTLLHDLTLSAQDVFYDLGCGLAQTCLQVALTTPAKAKGVELSKTRIERAQQAVANLKNIYGIDFKDRVELHVADITKTNFSDATVIFLCSTCFSDKLMQQISNTLSKTQSLRYVITLRKMPENNYLTLFKTYQLPMTWNNKTTVYVYAKNKG